MNKKPELLSTLPVTSYPQEHTQDYTEDPSGKQRLTSVADSYVIYSALVRARQKWLTSVLPKFSSKSRSKFAQQIHQPPHTVFPLGKGIVSIGPLEFHDTRIYEVEWGTNPSRAGGERGGNDPHFNKSTPVISSSSTSKSINPSMPSSSSQSHTKRVKKPGKDDLEPIAFGVLGLRQPFTDPADQQPPPDPNLIRNLRIQASTDKELAQIFLKVVKEVANTLELRILAEKIRDINASLYKVEETSKASEEQPVPRDAPPVKTEPSTTEFPPNASTSEVPPESSSTKIAERPDPLQVPPQPDPSTTSVATTSAQAQSADSPTTPMPPQARNFSIVLEFREAATERYILPETSSLEILNQPTNLSSRNVGNSQKQQHDGVALLSIFLDPDAVNSHGSTKPPPKPKSKSKKKKAVAESTENEEQNTTPAGDIAAMADTPTDSAAADNTMSSSVPPQPSNVETPQGKVVETPGASDTKEASEKNSTTAQESSKKASIPVDMIIKGISPYTLEGLVRSAKPHQETAQKKRTNWLEDNNNPGDVDGGGVKAFMKNRNYLQFRTVATDNLHETTRGVAAPDVNLKRPQQDGGEELSGYLAIPAPPPKKRKSKSNPNAANRSAMYRRKDIPAAAATIATPNTSDTVNTPTAEGTEVEREQEVLVATATEDGSGKPEEAPTQNGDEQSEVRNTNPGPDPMQEAAQSIANS